MRKQHKTDQSCNAVYQKTTSYTNVGKKTQTTMLRGISSYRDLSLAWKMLLAASSLAQ
jgi:hypothetical protein